jgi:hypothetical protein
VRQKVGMREIWEEARRRLVERYIRDHPGVPRTKAFNIVSDCHIEIGAEMDVIERKTHRARTNPEGAPRG